MNWKGLEQKKLDILTSIVIREYFYNIPNLFFWVYFNRVTDGKRSITIITVVSIVAVIIPRSKVGIETYLIGLFVVPSP